MTNEYGNHPECPNKKQNITLKVLPLTTLDNSSLSTNSLSYDKYLKLLTNSSSVSLSPKIYNQANITTPKKFEKNNNNRHRRPKNQKNSKNQRTGQNPRQ